MIQLRPCGQIIESPQPPADFSESASIPESVVRIPLWSGSLMPHVGMTDSRLIRGILLCI